jgi:hypothetical protein
MSTIDPTSRQQALNIDPSEVLTTPPPVLPRYILAAARTQARPTQPYTEPPLLADTPEPVVAQSSVIPELDVIPEPPPIPQPRPQTHAAPQPASSSNTLQPEAIDFEDEDTEWFATGQRLAPRRPSMSAVARAQLSSIGPLAALFIALSGFLSGAVYAA